MAVMTDDLTRAAEDYDWIDEAVRFIDERSGEQPGLAELSQHLGISQYHLQRVFSRWIGISPKRFLQFVTKEHAKRLLEESRSLLDITYEVGLSSPSRLHDLFVTCEALTPGEYRERGKGLEIAWGFHPSPFGECLLALTDRGICWMSFTTHGDRELRLRRLRNFWNNAELLNDQVRTGEVVEEVFGPIDLSYKEPLHVYVEGTNFQIKVWEALLRIPPGAVASYGDVARWVGEPTAARAVGNAVVANPVAFLIPCHRVVLSSGAFGEYGAGKYRKRAILGWENLKIRGTGTD